MKQVLSKQKRKQLTSLKLKKHRRQYQQFLIEGFKLCEEALNSQFEVSEFYYCPAISGLKPEHPFWEKCQAKKIPLYEISETDLQQLADTVNSQGILALVHTKNYSLTDLKPETTNLLVALERVSDPGNLGTIIRTADWFGASAILIDEHSVDWLNPKVIRGSMGSLFHLPIIPNLDLEKVFPLLKSAGFQIFGATPTGTPLTAVDFQAPRKLVVLGNESQGLSKNLLVKVDRQIAIEGTGRAESLNVAVAAGIFLYCFQNFKG